MHQSQKKKLPLPKNDKNGLPAKMFPNDIVIIHETTSQIAITKLIPAVIAAKTPPTVFLVLLIPNAALVF